MIGVDTNLLLRLFLVGDPRHNALAVAFFAGRSSSDPAFISLVVMAEFAWVLKRRYGFGFDRIAPVIQAMLDSDDFVVERREVVEWSVAQFDQSKIDFSDLLISRSGEMAGCSHTLTFDRDAARRIPGMELLK